VDLLAQARVEVRDRERPRPQDRIVQLADLRERGLTPFALLGGFRLYFALFEDFLGHAPSLRSGCRESHCGSTSTLTDASRCSGCARAGETAAPDRGSARRTASAARAARVPPAARAPRGGSSRRSAQAPRTGGSAAPHDGAAPPRGTRCCPGA